MHTHTKKDTLTSVSQVDIGFMKDLASTCHIKIIKNKKTKIMLNDHCADNELLQICMQPFIHSNVKHVQLYQNP